MVGIFFLLVLLTLILVFWPRKTTEEELAGSLAKKVGKTPINKKKGGNREFNLWIAGQLQIPLSYQRILFPFFENANTRSQSPCYPCPAAEQAARTSGIE